MIMILLFGKFDTNFARSPYVLGLSTSVFAINESISFIVFQHTNNRRSQCVLILNISKCHVPFGWWDRLHCTPLYVLLSKSIMMISKRFLFILSLNFTLPFAIIEMFWYHRQFSFNTIFFMLILLRSVYGVWVRRWVNEWTKWTSERKRW